MSTRQKEEANKRTVEVLMRKRKLQPEYKEYADETHYRYAKTPKSSETRKKYWSRNKESLSKKQHAQYLKHRKKRLASRKEYVAKNIVEIRRQMREYYYKNRERILKKQKERRSN